MFSGKKFRLWSRHSTSSKKETEKEPAKDKRRTSQPKTDNEPIAPTTTFISPFGGGGGGQDNAQAATARLIQKLRDDNIRLEDVIKELTPFKIQTNALEKKLLATTKSFERKEAKYSTVISSLEYENEQLREEVRRQRAACADCYFCSRPQPQFQRHTQEPHSTKLLSATKEFQSKNDGSSNESMQSSESWRRLERLEEEQTAILKETSKQKQETSRCLQQISNELVKALISQKSVRKEFTHLQDRICHLEKQNEHLNKFLFRQHTPSSSSSSPLQTRQATVKRNELPTNHSEIVQQVYWVDAPPQDLCSTDLVQDVNENLAQKTFRTPYAPPYRNRFSQKIYRTTQTCTSKDYIPEAARVKLKPAEHASAEYASANAGCSGNATLQALGNRGPLTESETKSKTDDWKNSYLEREGPDKTTGNWEIRPCSIITLQDETEVVQNDTNSNSNRQQNTLNQGSNFSLNDILDGDIDQLRLSLQNLETIKTNNSARNLPSFVDEYFKDSDPNGSLCATQFADSDLAKRNVPAEKHHRYSYPVSLLSAKHSEASAKRALLSKFMEIGDADEAQTRDNTEIIFSNKQQQLESVLQKIERVIDNDSSNGTGKTNSLPDVECQGHSRDDSVTGSSIEDTTDEGLVWTFAEKEHALYSLTHEIPQPQPDSPTVDAESDLVCEIDILNENDLACEGNICSLETSSLQEQTHLGTHEEVSDSELLNAQDLEDTENSQTPSEPNLGNKNDDKPEEIETVRYQSEKNKSEDKISLKRDSITSEISLKDEDKEIAISKDKVTALTAYFEEVQAEQCQGHLGNHPKSRSFSLTSRSSTDSKECSAVEDDDDDDDDCVDKSCDSTRDDADEFQTIRYQRPIVRSVEETDQSVKQIPESNAEKPLVQDESKVDTGSLETIPYSVAYKEIPETGVNTGVQIQSMEDIIIEEKRTVHSVQDSAPIDSQTDTSLRDESDQTSDDTFSPEKTVEPESEDTKAFSAETETEKQEAGTSSPYPVEMPKVLEKTTGCEQIHCKSAPPCSSSGHDSVSPLQVNYVRTCSLKSFWDVVTPPPSPKSKKPEENHPFPDKAQFKVQGHSQFHSNDDDAADMTKLNETKKRGKEDNQGRAEQSKNYSEGRSEKETIPNQNEKEEIQHFQPNILPNVDGKSLENTRYYNSRLEDAQTENYKHVLDGFVQNNVQENSVRYAFNNATKKLNRTDPECEEADFLSEQPFSSNQETLETSKFPRAGNSADGVSREPTGNKLEYLLGKIHSDFPTPRPTRSGRTGDARETQTGTGTLTEDEIRGYQLGCHDNRTKLGCHDDGVKLGCHDYVVDGNHPWSLSPTHGGVQLFAEMDNNFESPSRRGLSSKPPIPPRRLHVTRCYAPGDLDLDQEIPDYEELLDADEYPSTEKGFCATDDNHRNLGLDMERKVFHSPKTDVHIPRSPVALTTDFKFTIPSHPVQFRNYSKSWDGGKRNSYPAARFRSFSQPEEQWDNVVATESAWNYDTDSGKYARPLSAYQAFNAPASRLVGEVPSRTKSVKGQQLGREESQKNPIDAENELEFYEITKQIETLKQTVNELQNKGADSSNSRF